MPAIKNGLLLLAVLLSFKASAQKIELQFKLNPAKTYTQTALVESNIKQTIQGMSNETKSTSSASTQFRLESTGDTASKYSVRYDNISLKVEAPGMMQEYNSDTTQLTYIDPMSKVLAGMTARDFQATISPTGKVLYVEGLEELIKEATESSTGAPSLLGEEISSGFGDGGFAKNIEVATKIFPSKKLKIGDSWEIQQYSSTGMPLLIKNIFTLKSIDNGIAFITCTGEISIDPENRQITLQGMDAIYFLKGTRSGELEVEIESGWTTSAIYTDEISGSMTISPNGQIPDGATIPIELKNTTTVSGK